MLTLIFAAQAAFAAPIAAQQNGPASACDAVVVAVSVILDEPRETPRPADGRLPSAQPEGREPAQAQPDCRPEPPKRRKRKSDYPMV